MHILHRSHLTHADLKLLRIHGGFHQSKNSGWRIQTAAVDDKILSHESIQTCDRENIDVRQEFDTDGRRHGYCQIEKSDGYERTINSFYFYKGQLMDALPPEPDFKTTFDAQMTMALMQSAKRPLIDTILASFNSERNDFPLLQKLKNL